MIFRTRFSYLLPLICVFAGSVLSAQESRDALLEFRTGRFDKAIEVCLNEIKQDSSNMDAYSVLCWSLIQLSRYDEAAMYAEKGRTFSRYDPRL
ncbi:MAG: hypothetical protein WCT14_17520, partial [Treponemataceae bacterium]